MYVREHIEAIRSRANGEQHLWLAHRSNGRDVFMSAFFGALPSDGQFHAFLLAWTVGAFTIVMETELARLLQKSGITPVGFYGFLVLNLLLVSLFLAVFADIVVPSAIDTPILMVVYLIIGSAALYVILLLWMAYQWNKSR
ncbi:MAG: hypothetical protein DRO87_11595 [Candidatus Thorarchaeota archaeon]|nr:MAG: hypothetical protein DRO87_11595 [Candidatus Thorarchaeota archaeon]RLI58194.1 MAG: hypothetical protein DRP09_00195 [Candidatus Thorarchaeota archaeon]